MGPLRLYMRVCLSLITLMKQTQDLSDAYSNRKNPTQTEAGDRDIT